MVLIMELHRVYQIENAHFMFISIAYILVSALFQLAFNPNDVFKTEGLFSFIGTFPNGEPMGIPMMVTTFSDGAFVLYEYDNQSLKKFDNNGNHIKNLTNRGRGPGEFLDIDHIFIDRKDRLLVTDHVQFKITVINPDQEKSDHFIFKNRPRIRSFHQTIDGQYIIGFRNYSGTDIKSDPEMFHKIDENLELHKPGFISPKGLHRLVPGAVSEVVMRGTSGRLTDNSVLTVNDDLLVVPALYNGKMLLYNKVSDYEEYEIIEVSGDYGVPYEEFQEPRHITQQMFEEEGVSMVNNPVGRTFFLHFNRSLGLFNLNTGHIVHFAQIKEGKKAVLVAEILDEQGKEVLYAQKLETLGNLRIKDCITEYNKYSRINLEFHHLDHQNRLFVSLFGENDMPELHVIQLNVEL